ncbi:DUF2958 domain-containing protein [Bosea beijingensis]|uniref:DUF2958 domain-containing protein n=1 Tax=Bosea beijingensis TaxID=3068632 RepID=UPI002741AE78|nr:DUF2958 domain-containing protein [Bosea sp. REN20]
MIIIPEDAKAKLLANGELAKARTDIDPMPVLKLFAPWDQRVWLISEMSPDDNDVLFGLVDLGVGDPEVGMIILSELGAIEGLGGLRVEIDRYFRPNRTLNAYASDAAEAGRYVP